jgi:hypothetical protein
VTLLKLDVEGYELNVLRGCPRILSATSFIYCELSPKHTARFGHEPRDVERLLLEHEFLLARRRPEGYEIGKREIFASLSAEERGASGFNLVAVKRDAVPEFTTRVRARGLVCTL